MNIEDYREYCLSYNESPKHWIGINPATAPDETAEGTDSKLLRDCQGEVQEKKGKSLNEFNKLSA